MNINSNNILNIVIVIIVIIIFIALLWYLSKNKNLSGGMNAVGKNNCVMITDIPKIDEFLYELLRGTKHQYRIHYDNVLYKNLIDVYSFAKSAGIDRIIYYYTYENRDLVLHVHLHNSHFKCMNDFIALTSPHSPIRMVSPLAARRSILNVLGNPSYIPLITKHIPIEHHNTLIKTNKKLKDAVLNTNYDPFILQRNIEYEKQNGKKYIYENSKCLNFDNEYVDDYNKIHEIIKYLIETGEIKYKESININKCDCDGFSNLKDMLKEYPEIIINCNHLILDAIYAANNLDDIDIDIPNGIHEIEPRCFNEFTNLREITIPDSVTYIGDECFAACSNLSKINILANVSELSYKCFADCSNLQEVNMPISLKSINDSCFINCSNLQQINIPSNVSELDRNCFKGCSNLQQINIPDSVTYIGSECFAGCSNLQQIKIPSNVSSIGSGCFNGCRALITIDPNNSRYEMHGHTLYDKDLEREIY